ncbi:SRPBCC family protein [Microbacterium sp. ARD31]|uniref:SRPBCC family protein n=1 Tax=Microbacterium sp. ARD31 TaxID=2962576 RepID=UPI002881608F|nr:SRPBCC family protein [Microbacterium sp. ARD31]MDT0185574.1 SRPBCC family protein [Microbacterium sp. ARD31]
MSEPQNEPQSELRHEVTVAVPPQAAFDAFLQLDRIKPREHNLLAVPIAETVVEPHVGGGIIDLGTDGTQCQWGTVLAYDPPNRFTFSWNIGPDWQTTDDSDRVSEVEVTFTADGDGTRVTLIHRHLERHGDGWESLRDGVDAADGWPLYLDRFAAVAAQAG